MAITTTDSALLRLLQLSSAALPVGGYAFSQGMETAVEKGWLRDAEAVGDWLAVQLQESLARVDLPLLQRALWGARARDFERLWYWNDYTLACRETAELRLTDTAMGAALIKLLENLAIPTPRPAPAAHSFVTAFAIAGAHWQLDSRAACHGYVWAWLENQVAAATKLVPLGQSSAQRLLGQLLETVPTAVDNAQRVADDEIGASLPGLAMASVWHETQYSRLFRS
ncbi:MAG: urease accessory protein UreF [Gammaproteobacteria bacterium]|nr:urease accessory protein UreF [Gammaproteobacteria bacterium]